MAEENVYYWTFTDAPYKKDEKDISKRKSITIKLYPEGESITNASTPKFCEVARVYVASEKNIILYAGQI
ncbi:hypothetical protein [Clostridioides difficile]|uniref:hypothetical protein n=1 Tax=Clostridioides difficile TaxID=1496 RepID=UPI000BB1948E|nr:hypothetical protein [Clostridioides difficile]PBE54558.1 hypothetical protein BGU25_19795 [Clostridioides difficile]